MTGYKDFIIHIPKKHRDTITTESGLKIHADHRFSSKETANTIFNVLETPLTYSGPIKKGFFIMVDPTLVMEQQYELTGHQENINLVDRDKNLYKVNKSFIICYKEKIDSKWIGYDENIIVQKVNSVKPKEVKKNGLYLLESSKPKKEKGKAKVFITNKEIESQGVKSGNNIFIDDRFIVDIRIEGNRFSWAKNRHVLAMEI